MEHSDFATFWLAARALLDGVNPSDRDAFNSYLTDHGFQQGLNLLYQNPPWSLALLLILAPFGIRGASILNDILNLCACSAPILLFLPSRRSLLFAAPLLMVFSPVIDLFQLGQITGLSLLCLGGGVALAGTSPLAAGALLGLSTVKAHLFLPVYAFLCVSSLRRGKWLLPVGIALSVAAQWSVVMALNPSMGPTSLGSNLMTTYLNPSLGAWLHYLTGYHSLRYLPAVVGCIGVTLVALRPVTSGYREMDQLPWLLCCALLSTPYAWSYDFILLIPALAVTACAASLDRSVVLPYLALLAGNIILLCTRIEMAYTGWYPLLVTFIYLRVMFLTRVALCTTSAKG